ncbi:MAG: acyl carrier protein [Acidobacteriia bacterium]|nr:acyl carrier protein [Terriglobia bacterium]
MSDPEIKNAVFKILRRIAPEANLDQINSEENLREALDIDSFDYLNLMIGLHEELKVEIPESDYRSLGTLGELVRYLAGRLR